MSQPQAIELDLPICHSESRRPSTEVLNAEQVGPNRYRLVYSPGMVEGIARDDEFELSPTDPKGFNVLKRAGYLCVWFYFEEPGKNRGSDGEAVRIAVERFGGICDGGGNTNLVFSVAASFGFPAVEVLFNELAGLYPGSSWLFGNVYNPWNVFKPLSRWE